MCVLVIGKNTVFDPTAEERARGTIILCCVLKVWTLNVHIGKQETLPASCFETFVIRT